jgi:hypothetical protein
MTIFKKIRVLFNANRILFGLTTGVITWLVFAFCFNKPGQFTPYFCISLMMMVSGVFEPKKTAGAGAIIGLVAGMVWGSKLVIQSSGSKSLVEMIALVIALFISTGIYMVVYAFLGYLSGTVVKLYEQGAIF